MSENDGEKKVNLGALGAHFGQKLVAHAQLHESTKVQSERISNLAALRGKLSNLIERDHELHVSYRTKNYHVEDREDGTSVAAYITTGIAGASLKAAVDHMTDPRGGDTKRYRDDGASYKNFDGRTVTASEIDKNQQNGIHVYAQLESSSGQLKTESEVYVGTIIDPETILMPVPKENPDDTEEYFKVIGPEDSHFEPIMTLFEHVNQAMSAPEQ